jgi:hypothetical protein
MIVPLHSPIGIDLDNTIVSYDTLFFRLARERGFIAEDGPRGKKAIRDAVRLLPDGDLKWQHLQGDAYGPRMAQAILHPGVDAFFARCRDLNQEIFIISHKTKYAGYDATRTNLRLAALQWLDAQGFFRPGGLGLTPQRVFFESTRAGKIERIKSLGCTLFIDDLEETFNEPAFPAEVTKILLDPQGGCHSRTDLSVLASWGEIIQTILPARA